MTGWLPRGFVIVAPESNHRAQHKDAHSDKQAGHALGHDRDGGGEQKPVFCDEVQRHSYLAINRVFFLWSRDHSLRECRRPSGS